MYNAHTQLTKNFKYGEFFSAGLQPPDSLYSNILKVAQELQKVRDIIGLRININSGWRTKEYNKAVGGSIHSQHLLGKAADISCHKMSPKVLNIYLSRYCNFNGMGIGLNYTHVDTRAGKLTIWVY